MSEPTSTREQSDYAEAVGVAEVLDLCLRIISQDAGILAASVRLVAEQPPEIQPEYISQLSSMAVELAEKANRMVRDTAAPMLGPVVLKEALAKWRRVGEVEHFH